MDEVLQLFEQVAGSLGNVARSEVVVGKPIVAGNTTIVPLSRVCVGFGGGGGEGEGNMAGGPRGRENHGCGQGKGSAGGAGGGARVRPVAVVVFSEEGVEVHPVPDKKGLLDKILEKVPELIEMCQKVPCAPPAP